MYSLTLSRDLDTQTHRISRKDDNKRKNHSGYRLKTQQIFISSNDPSQHLLPGSQTKQYSFSNPNQFSRRKHLDKESINQCISRQTQCYKNIAEILSKENKNLSEQNAYLLERLNKTKIEEKKYIKMTEQARKYKHLYFEALTEINRLKQQSEAYREKASDMAIIALHDISKLQKKVDSFTENSNEELTCYCGSNYKDKGDSYGKVSTRSSSEDGSLKIK